MHAPGLALAAAATIFRHACKAGQAAALQGGWGTSPCGVGVANQARNRRGRRRSQHHGMRRAVKMHQCGGALRTIGMPMPMRLS